MIAMRVGRDDEIDSLSAQSIEQRGDIGRIIGARIDDGDMTVADDISAGTGMRVKGLAFDAATRRISGESRATSPAADISARSNQMLLFVSVMMVSKWRA